MISYSLLFSILSLMVCVVVVLYLQHQTSALNQRLTLTEDKLSKLNEKDPYEDYRNAKGRLSIKVMREVGRNGKH